ncbi:MAG: hypothetical protein AB7D06_13380 [Pedobacter sp.]
MLKVIVLYLGLIPRLHRPDFPKTIGLWLEYILEVVLDKLKLSIRGKTLGAHNPCKMRKTLGRYAGKDVNLLINLFALASLLM